MLFMGKDYLRHHKKTNFREGSIIKKVTTLKLRLHRILATTLAVIMILTMASLFPATTTQAAPFRYSDDIEITRENFLEFFYLNNPAAGIPLGWCSRTGNVTITEDERWRVGSTTLAPRITMNQDFSLQSEVFLGTRTQQCRNIPGITSGADGIGFVFHPGGTRDVGSFGGALGIGGLPNAIGFKLDTWHNNMDNWTSGYFRDPLRLATPAAQLPGALNPANPGWGNAGRGYAFGAFVTTGTEPIGWRTPAWNPPVAPMTPFQASGGEFPEVGGMGPGVGASWGTPGWENAHATNETSDPRPGVRAFMDQWVANGATVGNSFSLREDDPNDVLYGRLITAARINTVTAALAARPGAAVPRPPLPALRHPRMVTRAEGGVGAGYGDYYQYGMARTICGLGTPFEARHLEQDAGPIENGQWHRLNIDWCGDTFVMIVTFIQQYEGTAVAAPIVWEKSFYDEVRYMMDVLGVTSFAFSVSASTGDSQNEHGFRLVEFTYQTGASRLGVSFRYDDIDGFFLRPSEHLGICPNVPPYPLPGGSIKTFATAGPNIQYLRDEWGLFINRRTVNYTPSFGHPLWGDERIPPEGRYALAPLIYEPDCGSDIWELPDYIRRHASQPPGELPAPDGYVWVWLPGTVELYNNPDHPFHTAKSLTYVAGKVTYWFATARASIEVQKLDIAGNPVLEEGFVYYLYREGATEGSNPIPLYYIICCSGGTSAHPCFAGGSTCRGGYQAVHFLCDYGILHWISPATIGDLMSSGFSQRFSFPPGTPEPVPTRLSIETGTNGIARTETRTVNRFHFVDALGNVHHHDHPGGILPLRGRNGVDRELIPRMIPCPTNDGEFIQDGLFPARVSVFYAREAAVPTGSNWIIDPTFIQIPIYFEDDHRARLNVYGEPHNANCTANCAEDCPNCALGIADLQNVFGFASQRNSRASDDVYVYGSILIDGNPPATNTGIYVVIRDGDNIIASNNPVHLEDTNVIAVIPDPDRPGNGNWITEEPLPPGNYQVTVSVPGFDNSVRNIVLDDEDYYVPTRLQTGQQPPNDEVYVYGSIRIDSNPPASNDGIYVVIRDGENNIIASNNPKHLYDSNGDRTDVVAVIPDPTRVGNGNWITEEPLPSDNDQVTVSVPGFDNSVRNITLEDEDYYVPVRLQTPDDVYVYVYGSIRINGEPPASNDGIDVVIRDSAGNIVSSNRNEDLYDSNGDRTDVIAVIPDPNRLGNGNWVTEEPLPPGNYQVTVSVPGFDDDVHNITLDDEDYYVPTRLQTPDDVYVYGSIRIDGNPPASNDGIYVVIRDSAGNIIASNRNEDLYDSNGDRTNVTAVIPDPTRVGNGNWITEEPLPPGNYQVTTTVPSFDDSVRNIILDAECEYVPTRLQTQQQGPNDIILEGSVRINAEPADDFSVVVRNSNGDIIASTCPDDIEAGAVPIEICVIEGTWIKTEPISPGDFEVTVSVPGFEDHVYDGTIVDEDYYVPTRLQTGQQPPGNIVNGRVRVNGEPPEDCEVIIRDSNGNIIASTCCDDIESGAIPIEFCLQTGEWWTVEPLPPGNYQVTVSIPGFDSRVFNIEIIDEDVHVPTTFHTPNNDTPNNNITNNITNNTTNNTINNIGGGSAGGGKAPNTGDDANLTLWIFLAILSASGLVFVICYGKKRIFTK